MGLDVDTKVVKIDDKNIDESCIDEAALIIRNGGLVAFPTETVYGLGANGLDEAAVKRIYEAKGRPGDNPLILHINDKKQLDSLVKYIPDVAHRCMDMYWPGPLTILFKKSDMVPDIISAGLDTVAVRMPNNKIALELIKGADTPIAAPSANLSGKPSPTQASHVIEDLWGKVDMIIDGGMTGVGLESTVLDLSGDSPMILRPGGVTLEALKSVVPNVTMDSAIIDESEKIIPRSPGQKYRHYAPKADMTVFTGDQDIISDRILKEAAKYVSNGQSVGIMATEETKGKYHIGQVLVVGSRNNKESIASNLFTVLREFDNLNVDIILAEGVESDYIGMAIMNRLRKAAGGQIIIV